MLWGHFSSHRDVQKQLEGHFCTTFVPLDWQWVLAEHFCVTNRTCTSPVHVVIEIFPSWNGFSSHVTGPNCPIPTLAHTNQAQKPEWNTNVECLSTAGLASAPSPGTFVPRKPQYSQDNLHHATLARVSQTLQVALEGKHVFSVYFEKSAPTWGGEQNHHHMEE